jgi:ABC-type nitrate/sulfonate/bicarbonate transport system substrate-binding protein
MTLLSKPLAAVLFTTLALLVSPARAAEKLVFAWTPNPQTPQVDVALAKGYFKAADLDVQLVAFASGREGFEALIGGQVDVSFMAEFPASVGVLRGQKFGIIGDLARFRGSRIIASGKGGELKSAADLNGLRIGTTLGTNVDYFLSKVLTANGIKAELVNAAPGDLVPALVRGDIRAAVMFPTFYGAAKRTLAGDYRDLKAADYSPHYILAASAKALADRPKVLEAFLAALVKADADVAADPASAQVAVLANLKAAMPKEELAELWKDTEFGLTLDGELLDLLKAQAAWIVERGVVKAAVPADAVFRAAFADGPLKTVKPDAVKLP